ncbi:MAG: UvrD-helicase domain-containing protein [Firmicutes bacterium]|nr:UvrD-helicase domain-containing protein [Bacillota bacterium]
MDWSKEQLEAIETTGRDLLVSAAAGSGKTAVLAERVRQLCDKGSSLDRMLIITFTNAAAAEMRQRILKKVKVSLYTRTHISTFDSLAIEIYRQYYHVIDAPPGLKICDPYRQNILRNESMDELFEDSFEKGDEDFKRFLLCTCSPKNNDNARFMISGLYDFIQSMPDPFAWLKKLEDGEFFDEKEIYGKARAIVIGELEEALAAEKEAFGLLLAEDGNGTAPLKRIAEKLAPELQSMKDILMLYGKGEDERAAALLIQTAPQRPAPPSPNKAEKPIFEAVKDEVAALRKYAREGLRTAAPLAARVRKDLIAREKKLLTEQTQTLCRLTRDYSERYGKKKLADGLMDFSDAQHYALKILRDPQVSEELKGSFDHIFVDEYQDSNYVQEEMVKRLSRGNNVFMVGDIKQSIYKFRQAEPEIFMSKYKAFKAGAAGASRAVDLNRNFRSKGPVIDIINKVFRRVMTEEAAGMDYDSSAELTEGAPYKGPNVYDPKLYLISTKKPDGDAGREIAERKAAELEAMNAAEVLASYHGKRISAKEGDRDLKWSDMAILLRGARNKAEIYYKALTDKGIPAYLERGEGYFDTPEIQLFLNLLRIIDNPRQDIPLISVMHFPGFGFSADELARIRIETRGMKGSRSYCGALECYASGACGGADEVLLKKTRAFLDRLTSWRKKAEALPLADFIWELLAESGTADFARALPKGAQRMANLRAMADRAQSFEQESAGGISGFVSYMELLSGKEGVGTGQASVITEADDVVKIMTIHKSKGLEFPFVLVAGMGDSTSGRGDRSSMVLHRDMGCAFRLRDPENGIFADGLCGELISRKLREEALAEEIRVLYVAMTRARDMLVMSALVNDAEKLLREGVGRQDTYKKYVNMVLPAFPKKDVVCVLREELAEEETKEDVRGFELREGIRRGFAVDDKELPVSREELKRRLSFVPALSPEDLLKRKYSVSELMELVREETPQKGFKHSARSGSQQDAIDKGNAYHKLMEQLPFTPEGKDAESIESFIEDLREKHVLSEKEASLIDPQRVAAFFASELGKRAVASPEVRREAPFILSTSLDGRPIVVQGVIDCCFKEGDGYVLVDYKSSYVDEKDPESSKEILLERYREQLRLYKEALETIEGRKVTESALYLFGLNDWVSIKE